MLVLMELGNYLVKKKYCISYMDNPTDTISKRFINGLKKHNLTYEEIKNNWEYIGGEKGHHLKYFNKYINEEIPEHRNHCICGHKIKNNCFISDGNLVLSIGESCINKFLPKKRKTCDKCKCNHRNRKDNLCNKCRKVFTRKETTCILTFN